jgi:hypothetical protein
LTEVTFFFAGRAFAFFFFVAAFFCGLWPELSISSTSLVGLNLAVPPRGFFSGAIESALLGFEVGMSSDEVATRGP